MNGYIWIINHKDDESLIWSKKRKKWLDFDSLTLEEEEETEYQREPRKIPENGVVEEIDLHITCPSYPNCDIDPYGCDF